MRFANLFHDFTHSEKTGGIILLICTAISLWAANATGAAYVHFWHTTMGVGSLNYSLEHWINDGLMAVFFLLVGLEIEREIYIGELSGFRKASLPIAAALGGMLVPALIHFLFNRGTEMQNGFGIPMATDIAFALGMLSLLGSRIPHGLKVFLTALAIIDDLGAILVIAIFYNTGISWIYLGGAMGIFALLLLFNRMKIHILALYLVPGVFMWYCMLQSGVHATISGVLLAFAIPFGKNDETNISYKLQHFLHKPVAFFVLPVFALANTAIVLGGTWFQDLSSPNSLGIMMGLLVGKPLGILLLGWILVRSGWGHLPQGVTWKLILGAGILAGIGFTMSIFIANLAFADAPAIQASKIAVLCGSLLSTLVGLAILYLVSPKRKSVLQAE